MDRGEPSHPRIYSSIALSIVLLTDLLIRLLALFQLAIDRTHHYYPFSVSAPWRAKSALYYHGLSLVLLGERNHIIPPWLRAGTTCPVVPAPKPGINSPGARIFLYRLFIEMWDGAGSTCPEPRGKLPI